MKKDIKDIVHFFTGLTVAGACLAISVAISVITTVGIAEVTISILNAITGKSVVL